MQPHAYQQRDLDDLLEAAKSHRRLAVVHATGAGKTLVSTLFVQNTLGSLFTHVISATPMDSIRVGFERAMYDIGARTGSSWNELVHYLQADSLANVSYICCHASINRQDSIYQLRQLLDSRPDFLNGKLLIVDEAQHAGADGLSEFVELWYQGGGHILYLTATPYRSDGRTVIPEGTFTVYRTMCQQMRNGFAPRILCSEIIDVGGKFVECAGVVGAPEAIAKTADAMVSTWDKDKRPFLIIRVKNHSDSGYNKRVINTLVQKFSDSGARVLNATDHQTESCVVELRNLLQKTSEGIPTHDVIIGIQRVAEGLDWPICSHIYLWGVPKSLPMLVQILGRAMRRKSGIVAEQWRDCSKLVLFTAGVNALAHSRYILLTAYLLSDFASSRHMSAFEELHGLIDGLPVPVRRAASAGLSYIHVPEDLRQAIRIRIDAIFNRFRDDPARISPRQLLEVLIPEFPELSKKAVQQLVLETYMSSNPKALNLFREQLQDRLLSGNDISKTLNDAVESVLMEFREETIIVPQSLITCQMHGLSGESIQLHSDKLRLYLSPLSEQDMLRGFDHFFRTYKRFPNLGDVNPINPLYTFETYDRALRDGDRSLKQVDGGFRQVVHERFWKTHSVGSNATWAELCDDILERLKDVPDPRKIMQHIQNTGCPTFHYYGAIYKASEFLEVADLLKFGPDVAECMLKLSKVRLNKCLEELIQAESPEDALQVLYAQFPNKTRPDQRLAS
jgi:hypothetical protein